MQAVTYCITLCFRISVWLLFSFLMCEIQSQHVTSFPRSTFISQQSNSSRIHVVGAFVLFPVWSSSTTLIACNAFFLVFLFFLLSRSNMSASSPEDSIVPPSVAALCYCSLACGHGYGMLHVAWLAGDGSISYTDLSRNLSRSGS